jgi:hypothetical protein
MNDILKNATIYRNQVAKRAVAHELSAEYHRHRGVQIGVAATVVSTIVGSVIFVTIFTKLGLDGKGTIAVPSQGWAWFAYIGFGLSSVLAPVLTGLQAYLNHPGQAEKHTASRASYDHVKRRLDSFLGRYESANFTDQKRDEALKELDGISKDMGEIDKNSIPLTGRAKKSADEQINLEGIVV